MAPKIRKGGSQTPEHWLSQTGTVAQFGPEYAPEPDETSRWLQVNISGDPCVAELQSIPAPSNKADLVKVHYGEFTLEVPDSCSRERMYELLQVVKAL